MSETQRLLKNAINSNRKVLTIQESKKILKNEGFPVNPTSFGQNLDELLIEAKKIGFPVAIKISSEDIVHKSDFGGVVTGIRSENELKEQYNLMHEKINQKFPNANIEGTVIEKMESGIELFIGSTLDPMFGPILAFGLGGIYIEVLKDVVFRLIPIEHEDATEMIAEIKAAKILDGIRGQPSVNKKALIDLLMKTSSFITENPEIEELDLNPVFASDKGVSVVDARIILKIPA
ncbi:MAG: acetate--CoA ligase family protein [Candidatus Hodarchaeales archaeon]